jgi:HEAT repeat protein
MLIAKKSVFTVCWLLCCCLCDGQQNKQVLKDDIHALYDHDDTVRREAAQRLVVAGSRAIPLLVDVLCDKSQPHFDLAWPMAAKALGELRAREAAPCLLQMLGYNYPPIGSPVTKTDETLRDVDPAYAALLQIGAPAVPAIRSYLPLLHPEESLMAVRLLRVINTPDAKEAAEAYVKILEQQIRFTRQVLAEFGRNRDTYSPDQSK